MLTTPASVTALASRNASNAPGTVLGTISPLTNKELYDSVCAQIERIKAEEIAALSRAKGAK